MSKESVGRGGMGWIQQSPCHAPRPHSHRCLGVEAAATAIFCNAAVKDELRFPRHLGRGRAFGSLTDYTTSSACVAALPAFRRIFVHLSAGAQAFRGVSA
jgi:hypothetical protein